MPLILALALSFPAAAIDYDDLAFDAATTVDRLPAGFPTAVLVTGLEPSAIVTSDCPELVLSQTDPESGGGLLAYPLAGMTPQVCQLFGDGQLFANRLEIVEPVPGPVDGGNLDADGVINGIILFPASARSPLGVAVLSDLTVPAGVSLRFETADPDPALPGNRGVTGVRLMVTGSVQIDGTVDVSGQDATDQGGGAAGPGGGGGGAGGPYLQVVDVFQPAVAPVTPIPQGGPGQVGGSAWDDGDGIADGGAGYFDAQAGRGGRSWSSAWLDKDFPDYDIHWVEQAALGCPDEPTTRTEQRRLGGQDGGSGDWIGLRFATVPSDPMGGLQLWNAQVVCQDEYVSALSLFQGPQGYGCGGAGTWGGACGPINAANGPLVSDASTPAGGGGGAGGMGVLCTDAPWSDGPDYGFTATPGTWCPPGDSRYHGGSGGGGGGALSIWAQGTVSVTGTLRADGGDGRGPADLSAELPAPDPGAPPWWQITKPYAGGGGGGGTIIVIGRGAEISEATFSMNGGFGGAGPANRGGTGALRIDGADLPDLPPGPDGNEPVVAGGPVYVTSIVGSVMTLSRPSRLAFAGEDLGPFYETSGAVSSFDVATIHGPGDRRLIVTWVESTDPDLPEDEDAHQLSGFPGWASLAAWADRDLDGLLDEIEFGLGTDPTQADTDKDGLSDWVEIKETFTPPDEADGDNDGLSDGQEVDIGTLPGTADSDGDGLDDGDELAHNTDPLNPDTDNDGLDDLVESQLGTDPRSDDSDQDGLNDQQEIDTHNTDPLSDDSDQDGLNDAYEIFVLETDPNDPDSDDDGVPELLEQLFLTDANLADTDGDGASDYEELFQWFTDPRNPDSDGDGIEDGDELDAGLDPRDDDTDGDGVDDGQELRDNTDPDDPDSDDDGLGDAYEKTLGTNPNLADSDNDGLGDGQELWTDPNAADSDGDGLDDGDEVLVHHTSPTNADSDGDGLDDGDEVVASTNPLSADTDADGLIDGDEAVFGADPLDPDTDDDGISDGDEVLGGTDPTEADSDGDLLDDGEEGPWHTDPNDADSDGDDLPDGVEVLTGTDPTEADSDHDGVPDGLDPNLTADCPPPSPGKPWIAWYDDQDGDGAGGSFAFVACAGLEGLPLGIVPLGGDCDDTNPAVGGGVPYFYDLDQDGAGDLASVGWSCGSPPAGSVTEGGDCDDADPLVFPAQGDVCNGIDDDCDGAIDEGQPVAVWFQDQDDDGFGVDPGVVGCEAPAEGWVAQSGDCAAFDPDRYPGNPEVAGDGIDQDCTGADIQTIAGDQDGDGWCGGLSCGPTADGGAKPGDCNDADPSVHPFAVEVCDHADQDCDGLADEGLSEDYDQDGFTALGSCEGSADDCDDFLAKVWPGAPEVCDGIDQSCDGIADVVDRDGDGAFGPEACFFPGQMDCQDQVPEVHPGATEIVTNLVDDNCNGVINEDPLRWDDDQDGYCEQGPCLADPLTGATAEPGDCRDGDYSVNPGRPEIPNGVDDNCDGQVDELAAMDSVDNDGDGLSEQEGDCNDTNAAVFPGAPEACNGLDDDCDNYLPLDEQDRDDDGFLACDPVYPDCNDNDPQMRPFLAENCSDYKDNDCDGTIDTDSDKDQDGFTTCNGDCRDGGPANEDPAPDAIYPGADEACDGVDNDCDGVVDEGFDADHDGYNACGSACDFGTKACDCDDQNALVHPGLAEICGNGVDEDCVVVDENGDEAFDGSTDLDGDGFRSCDGDCDDRRADIHEGAVEVCDGLDNNCDGQVDPDPDGDGQTSVCGGDCGPDDPTINDQAVEICDGVDNDCDQIVDHLGPEADQAYDTDGDGSTLCDCDNTDPKRSPDLPEICGNAIDDDCDEVMDWDDDDCDPAAVPSRWFCATTTGTPGWWGLGLLALLRRRRR